MMVVLDPMEAKELLPDLVMPIMKMMRMCMQRCTSTV